MSTKGHSTDIKDLVCFIEERKVRVRCHNTWHSISQPHNQLLSAPNTYGEFEADQVLHMKDFRPSNLVSIVFEVLFTVKVQNREHFTVCLGYQTLIPEMMSDMPFPKEKAETLRLSKGPGETLDKQLMLSD